MNIFLQQEGGEGRQLSVCRQRARGSRDAAKDRPGVVGRFVGAGRVALLAVGFHDHGRAQQHSRFLR